MLKFFIENSLNDEITASGGNSSAARSLRVESQLRDRKGRWVEMGRDASIDVRIGGVKRKIIGKFVGTDPQAPGVRGLFLVEADPEIGLERGVYSFSGKAVKQVLASLDANYLRRQGIADPTKDVNGNLVGSTLDVDIDDIENVYREEVGELDEALADGRLNSDEIAEVYQARASAGSYGSYNVVANLEEADLDVLTSEEIKNLLKPYNSNSSYLNNINTRGGIFEKIDAAKFREKYDKALREQTIKSLESQLGRELSEAEEENLLTFGKMFSVRTSKEFREVLAEFEELAYFKNMKGRFTDDSAIDLFINSRSTHEAINGNSPMGDFVSALYVRGYRASGIQLPKPKMKGEAGKLVDEMDALSNSEIIELAQEELNDYLSQARPSVMTGYKNLLDIISSGRFKSVFETLASQGMEAKEYYLNYREFYENNIFNYDSERMSDSERPIYGGLVTDKNIESLKVYGEAEVVLKPSVIDRSTLTVGDSLNDFLTPTKASEPEVDDLGTFAKLAYLRKLKNQGLLENKENFFNDKLNFETYVELQIHGGVKVQDIEKVILGLPARWNEDFDLESLKTLLDSEGIAWEEAL